MHAITGERTLKERVQAGEKVERSGDLPEEYRWAAQWMTQFHANSEIVGTLPERQWISQRR